MGATPQRYKLFVCCSIPESKGCLIFEFVSIRFRAHVATFHKFLKMAIIYIKMHYRNKAVGVVGTIATKYGWL